MGLRPRAGGLNMGLNKGSVCHLCGCHSSVFHFPAAGVKISDVYNAVLEYVKKEKAELVSKLTKNFG